MGGHPDNARYSTASLLFRGSGCLCASEAGGGSETGGGVENLDPFADSLVEHTPEGEGVTSVAGSAGTNIGPETFSAGRRAGLAA